ncbi:Uncharacterised protein [Mycobacterium tuberculosis]|nr:Uncharacterised protein [Mycobacterium tuberculosis]
MDRYELAAALTRAGLREYEIEGVHRPAGRPNDYPYLRREGDRWAVGYRERGEDATVRRFTGEDEACRFFYDLVTSAIPPPPPEPSALEDPRLLERLEEGRRDAWDDYRRSRRAAEGEPPPSQ